jgi:hypothetical protein
MSLELTTGDTAPTLTGTVNADLTGSAIVVHIQRPDATVISRAGTIVGASAGTWSLALIAGDLTIRGTYYVEVEVTFSGGKIETFRKDSTGNRTSFRVELQLA